MNEIKRVNSSISRASITVFMTFVIIIIMAFLGSIIEVCRGKACHTHAQRIARMATDSLMCEYNRELYNRYRLFFLENAGTSWEKSMAEYAGATLGYNNKSGRTDIYDGLLDKVKVSDKRNITEDNGDALLEQVSKYIKISGVSYAFSQLMESGEKIDDAAGDVKKVDEQFKEDEEASKEAEDIIKLIELIDGIKCEGAPLKTGKPFMKMFCVKGKSAPECGYTNATVYDTISDQLICVDDLFDDVDSNSKRNSVIKGLEEIKKVSESSLMLLNNMGALKEIKQGTNPKATLINNIGVCNGILTFLKEKESFTKEDKEELKNMWNSFDYTGIVFEYSGIQKKKVKNPFSSVSDTMRGGILGLLFDDKDSISEKIIDNPDNYRNLMEEMSESKIVNSEDDNMKKFVNEKKISLGSSFGNTQALGTKSVFLMAYLKRFFSNKLNTEESKFKKKLDYEMEYIVCGKESDKQNLLGVCNRMIMMRTGINTLLIYSDSEKANMAYATAAALVGFTGIEALVRVTQAVIIVAWAMVESLVDVSAILMKRDVPIIKKKTDLKVSYAEMFGVNRSMIKSKAETYPKESKISMGYEEYLMMFIVTNKKRTITGRMMDIMEKNVRCNEKCKGFKIGLCYDSYKVEFDFTFKTKFFKMPYIVKYIDRKLYDFKDAVTIDARYVSF